MISLKNRHIITAFACIGLMSFAAMALADTVTISNPLVGVNSFTDLISKVTQYILTIIEGICVIVIVWAGILFVTSAGNEGQLSKAKKALLYAVIGLAVALAANGLIEVVKSVIGVSPSGASSSPSPSPTPSN